MYFKTENNKSFLIFHLWKLQDIESNSCYFLILQKFKEVVYLAKTKPPQREGIYWPIMLSVIIIRCYEFLTRRKPFFFTKDLFSIIIFFYFAVGIYLLKVNNRNTRTRCEICSKLLIKIPERRHWRRSRVFIVNFEHISHLILAFLFLPLNM